MKLTLAPLISVCCALALCAGFVSATVSSKHERMTLQVLAKSGPHTIANKTGKNVVTFHFRITGMTVDAHVGGRDVRGHGHVQMYLDHIPGDAYRKKDLTGIASYNAPLKVGKHLYEVSIEFDSAWIKLYRGTHHLLIGLAQNDDVMYHVKIISFALTVK